MIHSSVVENPRSLKVSAEFLSIELGIEIGPIGNLRI